MGRKLLNCDFSSENKPTKTLEYIRENGLERLRGFNFDNWGGYISYKLGTRVFIDDRADFYGEAFFGDYTRLTHVAPGWRDILREHKIDWVLIPPASHLSSALSQEPGWKLAARDRASRLYIKHSQ